MRPCGVALLNFTGNASDLSRYGVGRLLVSYLQTYLNNLASE
jgi:hypothetical protein